MNVCFILGSSQELSCAELSAVLTGRSIFFDVIGLGDACVELSLDASCNEKELMACLGGCVKIGSFLREIPAATLSPQIVADILFSLTVGRLTYGISVSSVSDVPKNKRMNATRLARLGFETKHALKRLGRQSRCVISQDSSCTLSSVVVEKNGLLKKDGAELLLIQNQKTVRIYRTQAVQPFEAFSQRDFGRPNRSMAIGMLPPKVARMMVNISGAPIHPTSTLLDPFCGTGTILQEALVLGVRAVVGTDNSPASLASTQGNLAWLKKTVPSIAQCAVDIRTCDARQLHALFRPGEIQTIVTETYLGPIVKKNGMVDQKNLIGLEQLYHSSFQSFARVLARGAHVVIALPFWPSNTSAIFLSASLFESLKNIGFTATTRSLLTPYAFPFSRRNSILWHRENQRVGREVCVFEYSPPTRSRQIEKHTRRRRAHHNLSLQIE